MRNAPQMSGKIKINKLLIHVTHDTLKTCIYVQASS